MRGLSLSAAPLAIMPGKVQKSASNVTPEIQRIVRFVRRAHFTMSTAVICGTAFQNAKRLLRFCAAESRFDMVISAATHRRHAY
jgi:hypothetical protein